MLELTKHLLDDTHAFLVGELPAELRLDDKRFEDLYDAERSQYIGKHRDSTVDMIEGAPIITISYGAERAFRLRPWKKDGFRDFAAKDGTLFVPHSAQSQGRRISITLRAFTAPATRA